MGAWSVSITGNDTAQDMLAEYSVAFSRHAPEDAVALLDALMHREMGRLDANDGHWVDYRYSLADYMWKKGVLYEALRGEVISMIDRGAGLDLYDNDRTLRKRERLLAAFRAKLLSPQPERKSIRLTGVQTKSLFNAGDVIAMQLDTTVAAFEGNPYRATFPFAEAQFRALNGMWIALRKVGDDISWRSAIDPEICDVWPCFQMYKGVSPVCPTVEALQKVPFARIPDEKRFIQPLSSTIFISDNTRTGYRRRNAQVIGKDLRDMDRVAALFTESVRRSSAEFEIVDIGIFNPITSSDLDLVKMLVQK